VTVLWYGAVDVADTGVSIGWKGSTIVQRQDRPRITLGHYINVIQL
jgi:hypothetical protein